MTAPFNPYAAIDLAVDPQHAADQHALTSSLYVASQRPPAERWARVLDLAGKTKLPAAVVDRNFDVVDAAVTRQQPDPARLASDTPGLATWLQDPDNATVGKTELAPLARVARGSTLLATNGPQGRSGFANVGRAAQSGYNDMIAAAGQLGVAFGLMDPQHAAAVVADANGRVAQLRTEEPPYVQAFDAAMQAQSRRGLLYGALSQFTQGASTIGEVLDVIGTYLSHPRGAIYRGVEGLAQSVPALALGAGGAEAGAAAGTIVPGVGNVVGGTAGLVTGTFLGMAPINVGAEINGELAKRGIDITKSDALARAYADPTLMATLRATAERKGLTSAAVSALIASVAGRFTAAARASGATTGAIAGATAADAGIQVAGQAGAELAGQVAGAKGDVSKVNLSEALQAGVNMLGYSIGETAIGASRRALLHVNPAIAAEGVHAGTVDALRAGHDAQALAELGDAIKEAPTVSSVPARLQQLVDIASGGDGAASVFFRDGDWDSYWQTKGASPAKAASDILGDGGKAYYEAKATGAPLEIPLGDYAAKVGTTEHYDALLPIARTRPDGMSLREAHEYLQSLPATMQELATEATTGAKAEPTAEDTAVKVGENVAAQLKKAGIAASIAKQQAALYESAFRTLGKRLGVDPLELFTRYQLQINRADANAPPTPFAESAPATEPAPAPAEPSAAATEEPPTPLPVETANAARPATEAGPLKPYAVPLEARDFAQKTAEGMHVYARTKSGALRENLSKVATEGLVDEYARLLEANSSDKGTAAGVLVHDENFHYTEDAGHRLVGNEHSMRAAGRIASRQKSIGKIEAELERRGVDNVDDLFARLMMQEPAVQSAEQDAADFPFFQSESPAGWGEAENLADSQSVDDYLKPFAGSRGRIRFGAQGQVAIDLFKAADRSTFLHETGHFYLKLLDDAARADIAPAELRADFATVREWLGAKEGEAFTRVQHEQFARGFEAYLMEGRAPTLGLREAFYRFKRWLTALYEKVSSLNVAISPEVRGVFDRLLASRDEIAQAEQVQNVAPLFTDPKAIGMTPEQAESYQRAIADAHQAAEEELTQKMMREIKREESAQWKQWREPIRAEVEQQLNTDPRYQALALLQRGTKPDGTPLEAGTLAIKLHRESVIATYGKETYTALPKGVTANHQHPNVVNPDIAAEMLGFPNGRALVDALAGLPARDKAIEQLTDARMQAEHGERLSPDQVRDQAAAAVHNEKRIQVLRKELEHLASDHLATLKGLVRAVTRKVPPTEVVREQADRIIGARTVKDVKPHLYELAAARAATAAREALLAGDIEGAYRAKHQELLATAVFNSATEARASIDAALDEFRDVFGRGKSDATLAKSRDMDLVNAARAILASVGVGKTDKPAAAYLESLRRYDPETYAAVQELVDAAGAVSATGSGDYRKLSVDDFTDLRETVASLWTLARRTRQIEIDGQKLDRAAITESLGASVEEITKPGPRAGYQRAVTSWDKTQMKLLGVRASLRRVEHWVRAMDGGADAGVFRKYVWNPVSEGITAYRLAKRDAIAKYGEIVKPLTGTVSREAIPAPELGYTFRDKAELLGAMLHVGNESNLSKLLRGRGWGAVDEQGVLDRSRWDAFVDRLHKDGTLAKPDYDYLQGVWDLFDELKAGAQRAHKELYGHYFGEVTADPLETPFGTYKGGYAPAKADPFIAADAQIRADREALEHSDNSFMFPTAGRGFTKARVEQYAKPLILDVGLVPSHLDAVLRFTHIEPRVRDVGRVIMDRGFREQLDAFDPTVGGDMLVPWLQRAALQRIELSSKGWGGRAADTFFRELRNRTGLQIFTANVVVTAEQLTHFPSVFVKVKPSAIGAALWRYVRQPKELASAIAEKSDFMKTRESAALMEVQHAIDNVMLKRGVTDQFRDFAKEHGHFLMRGVQSVMDHITWSAAYEEAAAKGLGEQEAVRHADSVIREALGSFAPEDLSRFETGTPFQRFFSMAYSFYNTKANMLTSEVTSTVRNMGLRKGAGRLLYIYTMGFMIPAVLGAAIKQGLSGKPLDEDDDGPWDDVAAHFFGSQLEMGMRAIPIAGPVVQTAVNAFDNKPQNDDIATSPAVHAIESAAHAPGDVYHAIHERMITTKEITDLFTLLGLASGLPIRPLAKPVGYLHDVSTGAAEPSSRADFARGLVTGARGSR